MTSILSGGAEMLFNALDNADMTEVNECLSKFPETVDERDEEQRVPLHYAADCADIETFQRILELNLALIDAQDKAGFTPLFVAVMAGNLEALELLIAKGAQLTHVDQDKHSAVHWAVVCGQLQALIVLLKNGAPYETVDLHEARPLHYATVIEDVSIERAESILYVLLKAGANVNYSDADGRTPLIWAASNGNVEGFKSLVQAGANKYATDNDRLGVLHCAACHGHSEIIRYCLEQCQGDVVNAKDRNGDTPLFYACAYGHYECAKILLEKNADVNHMDKRCRSPAHCAAAKGQLRILKLLKHYGASFELQNYRGDMAFHEAVQTGSQSLVEWLLTLEPKFVSAANFYGRTPLHLASASGNMELTVLLCTRGCKINPVMLYKNELFTPLDLARRREHQVIVEYLSQRHGGMAAADLSSENQSSVRYDIEERLKTAKLRRFRAQISSSDSDENNSEFYVSKKTKVFRREKSMLLGDITMHNGVNNDSSCRTDSRRTSSASGVRMDRLPKSTSTTDLVDVFTATKGCNGRNSITKNEDDSGLPQRREEEDQTLVDLERRLVESTIQKIVQDELRKSNAENGVENAPSLEHTASDALIRKRVKLVETRYDEGTGDGREKRQRKKLVSPPLNKRSQSSEVGERRKKKDVRGMVAVASNNYSDDELMEAVVEVNDLCNAPPLNLRDTEGGQQQSTNKQHSTAVITELHIIEDGWQPMGSGRLEFSGTAAERRYVHEKAIFEELTHLKRMQIQYGRVQERVLVRSLIANFCKMHGLSATHFHRYQTFYEWEKFLYDLLSDQLKMIYLEERDHIISAAPDGVGGTSINILSHRSSGRQSYASAMALPPPAYNITNGGAGNTNMSSISLLSMAVASHPFDSRLHRTSLLDERLRELTRIYSRATTSNNAPSTLVLPKQPGRNNTKKSTVHYSKHLNSPASGHNNTAQQQNTISPTPLKASHHQHGQTATSRMVEHQVDGGGKRCECFGRHAAATNVGAPAATK